MNSRNMPRRLRVLPPLRRGLNATARIGGQADRYMR